MVETVELRMLKLIEEATLAKPCTTTIFTWAAGPTTLKSCFHWFQASKTWTTSVSRCQSICCSISR